MLSPQQLKDLIVIPTLTKVGLASSAAVNLVCGTALVESNLEFIAQTPNPIALGLWQCESPTYHDLLNTLAKHKSLQEDILHFLHMDSFPPSYDFLAGNFYAGAIFCRLKYYFNPEPLPAADDINALADHWGRIYNTKNLMMDKTRFVSRYQKAYPC